MPFGKQVFLISGHILQVINLDNKQLEPNNNNEKENDNKKKIKLFLIFIIVFVIVFCGVYFAIQLYNNHITAPPKTTTAPTTQITPSENPVDNPIDFKSLQEKNDEIYAWIKVDDTNVDHPIVQSATDDEFYLKHKAEDKSWSASGAVYTELANSKNFKDPVTVIYGHNGYGDTMFTTLHRFEDEDFFNNHPYFTIYTTNRKLTYQIVSAFKYDDRHILNSFRFSDISVLEDFQKMIQNPDSVSKNIRTQLDTEITKDSKIVILSTCITNQKSNRLLICGVLTKDEKTN